MFLLLPTVIEPGFVRLFDGRTTSGWHGFKRQDVPKCWRVIDGNLTVVPGEDDGDLSSDEVYTDFDLRIEWLVAPGANSGIMYRADEGHSAPWMTGPEMQILDDDRHADGKRPETSAGSCYGLYARNPKTVKPAGQWNAARIVARGSVIEHWLNGKRVVRYVMGSRDWKNRVANTKFQYMIDYGTLKVGHIVLQDHGDRVAFRNIRIKRL